MAVRQRWDQVPERTRRLLVAAGAVAARADQSMHFWLYRILQLGVLLLAAGTILGGVWANYSWGRFWGWDPKETWALIALRGHVAVPQHAVREGPRGFIAQAGTKGMDLLPDVVAGQAARHEEEVPGLGELLFEEFCRLHSQRLQLTPTWT